MNPSPFVCNHFKAASFIIVLFGQTVAAAPQNKDCWVDFFEGTHYTGKHFRLNGPSELANLNDVNGEHWDSRISSIKTGPKATVTVFDSANFKLSTTTMANSPSLMSAWGITEKDIKEEFELIFQANATIHDLSDFHFQDKVKSLKITCSE